MSLVCLIVLSLVPELSRRSPGCAWVLSSSGTRRETLVMTDQTTLEQLHRKGNLPAPDHGERVIWDIGQGCGPAASSQVAGRLSRICPIVLSLVPELSRRSPGCARDLSSSGTRRETLMTTDQTALEGALEDGSCRQSAIRVSRSFSGTVACKATT